MTEGNAYQTGQGPDILYPVNGEFNDWCYGDTIAKPRAYTWTPEVGQTSDDFWPPASRIVPLAAENLRACYFTTAIAGTFIQADGYSIGEGALNASYGAHLTVRAQRRAREHDGHGRHTRPARSRHPDAGELGRLPDDPVAHHRVTHGRRVVRDGDRRHRHAGAAGAIPGVVLDPAGAFSARHGRDPARDADGGRSSTTPRPASAKWTVTPGTGHRAERSRASQPLLHRQPRRPLPARREQPAHPEPTAQPVRRRPRRTRSTTRAGSSSATTTRARSRGA